MPRKIVQEITAVDKTKGAFTSVTRSLGGLKGAVAAIGAAVTTGALGSLAKEALNSADEIQKLSTRLGASTEALSQYRLVADLTGVSFKTLTTGMQRATRRIAEAAKGTGEAKNAIAELGLEATALNNLRPEEQFEVLADAISNVGSSSDRVRIAMKLFDTEGVALLQTMQGGSAAIQEMRAEADRLGLTLSQEAADGAAQANDALTKLGALTNALGLTLARTLGPVINQVATWLQVNIPRAVQVAADAFYDLQQFVLDAGGVITAGLGSISGGLASAADFVGAETLSRALQKTADDYNDVSRTIARASVRIGSTAKSNDVLTASLQTGITFNQLYNAEIAKGASVSEASSKAKRKLADATVKQAQSISDYINQLKTERDVLGLTNVQLREYELRKLGASEADIKLAQTIQEQINAYEKLSIAAKKVADEQKELESFAENLTKAINPAQEIAEEMSKLDQALTEGLISLEVYAERTFQLMDKMGEGAEKAGESMEKVKSLGSELGPIISDSFGDAITSGAKFSDVLKGLENDLIRVFTRKLVTKPLEQALGGLFDGFGLDSLFGRALGGPVSAGRPYIVGENGPEVFQPSSNGQIIPANQSSGGGVYQFHFHGVQDADSFRRSKVQMSRFAMQSIGAG